MKQEATLIRARLKTPRAAAIAGILFSILLITGLVLFRLSVRADPLETGAWLKTSANKVALALNLVPFGGIAFLWFLAMLFASAAVAGGIIIAYGARPEGLLDSATFTFARAVTYETMNLYAVKMAGVFIVSTSTLTIRTGITPRWIAFLGFACALLLLFSGRYIDWILLVFPLWVLLISIYILIDNLRRPSQTAATNP